MAKIIAELCQNHNGDIKILEEMVHSAAESGADYAKIQSMHSSELTHRKRFDEGLIEGGKVKVIKRPYKAEYERLKKLDLEEKQHQLFLDFCKKYKIKKDFFIILFLPSYIFLNLGYTINTYCHTLFVVLQVCC